MTANENPTSLPSAAKQVTELAGLRRRLLSILYEAVLLIGVLAVGFLLPWGIALSQLGMDKPSFWLSTLELVHLFVLLGVYFVCSWHLHGLTLAMRTWQLRLVTTQGYPLTWRRACLRYVLAWPSVLCLGAGLVWAFFDLDKLFLHDRLAGTRIVRGWKNKD